MISAESAGGDAAWWLRRIDELEALCERLAAERKEQRAATKRFTDAAKRHDDAASLITDESLADEEAAVEATRRLQHAIEGAEEARAAGKAIDSQRAGVVREINEATLALGTEAETAREATRTSQEAENRAEGAAAESWMLRRQLRELGDRHAVMAEEAAEQRSRRVNVRETVRERMAKQEAERAELHTELRAHTATLSHLENRVAAARSAELGIRAEAREVRLHMQDHEAMSGSGDADCAEFYLRIREMRATDAQLRHELLQVQGQLRQSEAHAWDRS
mmetsp:Transcript_84545/g.217808  ORF Transcript_84545/g.217808 Transcript_84545/m.217808 type:complete len:279 (+) Transcript_84545:67-903(+)